MARLRIVFDGDQAGPKLVKNLQRAADRVNQAIRLTAEQTATTIEKRGRADISRAGRFGRRWTDGFHAKVSQGGANTVIKVTEDVPYWTVFQFGKIIKGKPLLWIPLSFASDAQGVRAKNFPQPLFRVDRNSGKAPLLLTFSGVPKYFGKSEVKIPKKFHLLEIAAEEGRKMADRYRANFKKV